MASHSDSVEGAARTTAEKMADTDNESPVSPMTVNEEFKDAVQEQQQQQEDVSPITATQEAPSQSQPPELSSRSSAPVARQDFGALGAATNGPIAPPVATGPTLSITLLLTTGARHPYKIDEKYLRSRKVEAKTSQGAFDPREISGYQLKELIWVDWRDDWDPKPSSPSSIRLIFWGKMIEDKAALKDFNFNLDATNVVHMTVRPADLVDDDDAGAKATGKGGVLRARDGEDRGAGCRCVIL